MAGAAQKAPSSITIKGSSEIICGYLDFGINSILYQRGLYPPEHFKPTENYGLTILMSQDEEIKKYLATTLSQLKEWLVDGKVDKVALIVTNVQNLEVMERWDFKVEYSGEDKDKDNNKTAEKPLKKIQNEIRDVLIQISSSVSYLPLLDCLCSFDIQFYTKNNISLPMNWADAEPANVKNAQVVKFRSISTNHHQMQTMVTYKIDE